MILLLTFGGLAVTTFLYALIGVIRDRDSIDFQAWGYTSPYKERYEDYRLKHKDEDLSFNNKNRDEPIHNPRD